jgi:hypothetical protein
LVARDGVEPPTPAFSGLYSTKVITLIQNSLALLLSWLFLLQLEA